MYFLTGAVCFLKDIFNSQELTRLQELQHVLVTILLDLPTTGYLNEAYRNEIWSVKQTKTLKVKTLSLLLTVLWQTKVDGRKDSGL